MSVPTIEPSFSKGEISPSLFGRTDLAAFHAGASTCRNLFVSYRGGLYSRAGTKFCGFSRQTGRNYPPRLITFQFSINQGLCLEFGNQYMRVVQNGAFVTEAPVSITAITQGNPCQVTAPAHGFTDGDWVALAGILGMTQLNGQTLIVANATTNTFRLTDVYGTLIDSSAYGAYAGGGTAARIYTLATPYDEVDIKFIKFTQSADVMSLTCWNQAGGTSYPPFDLTRHANNSWTLTQAIMGEKTSPPAAANGTASAAGTTDFQYVVTAFDGTTGEESVASPIADVPNSIDIGSTLGAITVTWDAVPGAGYYQVYKAPPAYGGTVPVGSPFGYAGRAFGNSFVDGNVVPDLAQVPPLNDRPFAPGRILAVDVTAGGAGLSQATVGYVVTTATGSGFVGTPIVIGGALVAFLVQNAGALYAPGDTIAITGGAAFAAGSIAFAGIPAPADTVTLNGDVWTFVNAYTGPNQTLVGSTLAGTLQALAGDLANSGDAALTVASYASDGVSRLLVTYKTTGAGGNAYTLAASVATPSGPTLTGGNAGGSGGAAATLKVGPQTGTWPSCVAYFQERRIYAATPNQPDTYFMSQPGLFTNFDSRIPSIASDAITGSPWSVQVNGIQFMVPMPGGLVVLTGKQAWQLTGTGGSSLNPQPITPSTQQAQPQAFNGCHQHVPPVVIDYDVIYVQAKGSILRRLSYNFFVNIYTGDDITFLSSHLFLGYSIQEMAWCEEPYKILWVVRVPGPDDSPVTDGDLLSLTHLKPQEVLGWARHDTQGAFCSVTSVTEPPVDALYLGTHRYPGGRDAYMIERMDDRIWPSVEDVWAVDAALALPRGTPDATLSASSAHGAGIITGTSGLVGGGGYAAATTIEIVDPTGSGCVATPTVIGGVITGISFVGGARYTYPQLNAVDPTGAGSGFSCAVTLDNGAMFAASAPVFAPTDVGSVIRMGGGVARITSYVDAQHATAQITSPIVLVIPNTDTPQRQVSGSWTLTAPSATVGGLFHLAGATVTGLADGQVVTPRVVDAVGTVTLDAPATAVVLGLGFQAQAQSLYADFGQPTIQGRRKKIAAITVRVEASRGFKTGANQPDGSVLSPAQNAPAWPGVGAVDDLGRPPYGSAVVPLYTGDVRVPLSSGFEKPGQAAVQQDDPLPLQLLAFIPELFPGDLPELQAQQQRGQQQ